jgi:uncharacterized DUF497 family protein
MPIKWVWDEEKAKSNFLKHQVTFSEAALVFEDPTTRPFPISILMEIAGTRLDSLGHF